MIMSLSSVFFFQAEDGIRDVAVTGVQTCALPISKTGRDASIMAVGALACLAAYAGLIPVYNLWGAAFATLLGFSVMLLYGLHQAQKLRRFPFEFRRLSQILACGAVTILFFYWLGIEGFWRQLATG